MKFFDYLALAIAVLLLLWAANELARIHQGG